ncbi:MAG TPA: hemolysin family protein [Gemmatimonadaceae bacterium]|nr:hemolysin family protein [Gemmatimonadaceae bacterium]
MIVRLIAIASLVAANAFFVAAEFALVRARRPRLEAHARAGSRLAAWALRAMASMPRMLSTSQLGITLSSLGLGVLLARTFEAVPMAGDALGGSVLRVAVAFIIVAYLHLVFGELVPRTVALAQPERVLRALSPLLLAFAWLTRPFTAVLGVSARLLTRRSRAVPLEERVHSPDELRLLVERSEEGGALQQQNAALLEGVFEFSEKTVREVMTPRTEIIALPVTASRDETLATVEEQALSRYPVYEGTIDNILGVFLAKDLIPVLHHPRENFSLRASLRPVHFVPWVKEVEDVLADFKRLKLHMAVVLDEFGGTAGVVTMEDLLEEIVGEIHDEYDEPAAAPERARSGELLVPGDMSITELNERFGLAVPAEDYTTIGGFVFGTLGRVPMAGDSVTAGGATFTVRAMDGRRIALLAVELVKTGVESSDDAAARAGA